MKDNKLSRLNKLNKKINDIIKDRIYNEQNAETDINKENEYELPLFLNPEITRAEIYNKKTKKWRDVDYYICLKIVKPLKTDKKLKIYYE